MKTYGVKYLGSKNKIIRFIIDMIGDEHLHVDDAIDVFTGTTRVAQALRQGNRIVHTSDLSWASEAYAYTFVHNRNNHHLQKYIGELNSLDGYPDWITSNYCDVIAQDGKTKVRIWQSKNGEKADAIRNKIEEYDLEHWEKMTLITSLIFGLDAVDNTQGIQYTCLKDWCSRSYNDLFLKLPPMLWYHDENALLGFDDIDSPSGELPIGTHFVGDALKINYPSADLAYLDPPYSNRSYAIYYHLWDSIVRWDKPDVATGTNRRIDRVVRHEKYNKAMDSPWYSKKTALVALEQLIRRLDVPYVLLSYSDDSLISVKDLLNLCQILDKNNNPVVGTIHYKRNIMSKTALRDKDRPPLDKNEELLILIRK